jgi:RecB family exonuclease
MSADARLRGEVLHRVLERFSRETPGGETRAAAIARLAATAAAMLEAEVPWPAARRLWQARLAGAAALAVDTLAAEGGRPVVVETPGAIDLPHPPLRLTARPDRLDERADGRIAIFDYKTGAPPTPQQQQHFDKQLLLTAMIAAAGGFAALGGAREVAAVTYLGLGATPRAETVATPAALLAELERGLTRQLAAYLVEGRGFAARRAVLRQDHAGDYDHLARFGEWQMSDPAVRLPVGVGA